MPQIEFSWIVSGAPFNTTGTIEDLLAELSDFKDDVSDADDSRELTVDAVHGHIWIEWLSTETNRKMRIRLLYAGDTIQISRLTATDHWLDWTPPPDWLFIDGDADSDTAVPRIIKRATLYAVAFTLTADTGDLTVLRCDEHGDPELITYARLGG